MGNNKKNCSQNFVIVIGRQYGSGGRRIGKLLADSLGVSYYDKSLLSAAAKRLGYSPEIFERKDEKRPSMIRSLISFTYGAPTAEINGAPMSDEKIYEYQSHVIKEICNRESCVIVGRTADYVMRDHPGLISIFVHADKDKRAAAIIRRGETEDLKAARDIADRRDHARESYYNYYTNGNSWGKASNYHLTFDSGIMPDDAIIAAVSAILRSRQGKS